MREANRRNDFKFMEDVLFPLVLKVHKLLMMMMITFNVKAIIYDIKVTRSVGAMFSSKSNGSNENIPYQISQHLKTAH